MPKFDKTYFQTLIAQGETETAIQQLLALRSQIRPPSLQSEVTHLSARWNDYERKARMGTASPDTLDLNKRQIDQSLLQLLERIEKVRHTEQVTAPKSSLWIGLAVVGMLLVAIVALFGSSLKNVLFPATATAAVSAVDSVTQAGVVIDTVEVPKVQAAEKGGEVVVSNPAEQEDKSSGSKKVVPKTALEQNSSFTSVQNVSNSSAQEVFDNGVIDWDNQYIEATGFAVINTEKYSNKRQATKLAEIGAKRVAQANLLEIIQAVKISRTTTVADFMTTSDLIKSKIEGNVRNTRLVGQPTIGEDNVEVKMRMPLYAANGLATMIANSVKANPEQFKALDLEAKAEKNTQFLKID